ncbi:BamA/TamA family outer membrane protein [Flavobacteriaceae bacterium GF1]
MGIRVILSFMMDYSLRGNFRTKVVVIYVGVLLASCNAVKKVPENEFLLMENTIFADSSKVSDSDVRNLLTQRPNSTILGYPFRLNLYNLAKENPDSLYQDWLKRKPKRQQRLNSLLSQKQVNRLGQSFVVRGISNLLKRVGEPPAIIDTVRTNKSVERLNYYYGSKGYFNNTVSYDIKPTGRKRRAKMDFHVALGKPYMVDSLAHSIVSKEVDSIYSINQDASWVKEGEQFDLGNFNKERERLTSIFRNSGVYNFQESSITYDIVRDTAQVNDDQKMDVVLNIKDLRNATDSSNTKEYRVNRFKKINIYADYQLNESNDSLQSMDFRNYTIYYKDELAYQPEALTDAIFFEQDSIYRELDEIRSKRQIVNLNTFKYPSFELLPDSTGTFLTSNIYLVPRPKFSLDTSLELTRSNIQQVGIGFGGSVIIRNVFKGAETLSLSGRGSIGILADENLDDNFTSEIGGDINLTFPRIWFPIKTEKLIPYYMAPQTRLTVGTNFQRNIGLDRQSLNSILSYNWSPDNLRRNTIELLNIEFVRNTDPDNFFNVYNNSYNSLDLIADGFDGIMENPTDPVEDFPELAAFFETVQNATDSLRLSVPEGTRGFIDAVTAPGFPIASEDLREVRIIEERKDRLTSDNLIFTSNYTFQKNNRESINDNDFFQYRIRFESAGNVLSLVENIIPFNQDDNGRGLVFSVPYSQYVKTEFDYIKHWGLSTSKVLAFRGFFGMAIPYGNSNSIPFVRSYFGGGSNDNRAWRVYALGPGRTDNENEFNEANLKLALNLEYRFPIVGDIKGAFFADAGNIWNVFDNVEDPDATFNGFSSLGDLALGTGFGLRYDFTYFVIRLDTGFKTYNPALEGSDRWFTDFNFREAVFNIGINYPF